MCDLNTRKSCFATKSKKHVLIITEGRAINNLLILVLQLMNNNVTNT